MDIERKKITVKEYLASSKNLKTTEKVFSYNNFLTDLVARAIDLKSPGGLKKAYQDFANKAGTSSEMFFIIDDNRWPLLHAWTYATREDFLKLGIQVSKDWNSNTCIGDYLKNIESMKDKSDNNNSEYAGFFWFDKKNKSKHAQMRGHGSQQIHIDLDQVEERRSNREHRYRIDHHFSVQIGVVEFDLLGSFFEEECLVIDQDLQSQHKSIHLICSI